MEAERRDLWLVIPATVVWGALGILGLLPAMFTPMMFDSPGSTSSIPIIVAALSILCFPLVCLVSIVAAWMAYRDCDYYRIKRWIITPLGSIAVTVAAFIWLNLAQAGLLPG